MESLDNFESISEDSYTLEHVIDEFSFALMFLHEHYNIDLDLLFLVYEILREHLFSFLVLFSGKKISIPTMNRSVKIINDSKQFYDCLKQNKHGQEVFSSKKSHLVRDKIVKMIEDGYIKVDIETKEIKLKKFKEKVSKRK